MAQDNVNPLGAFATFNGFETTINALFQNTNSASVALLALEGLFRIEEDVKSDQFTLSMSENIREFLRKWRCESPLNGAYEGAFKRVVPFLRNLTIFKTLEVPLFIDDYGDKRLMSDYGEYVEQILIDLDTPIVHVTHTEQKDMIAAVGLMPSNNKNIIEGLWFSPRYLGDPLTSVYGNWAFETTLGRLGVPGLRQGEVVAYKNEVNFIVYASDTVPQSPVVKATENAVKSRHGPNAYAAVSIFVPSRFLSEPGNATLAKFEQPYQVLHGPFCVPVKRKVLQFCVDLSVLPFNSPYPPPIHPQQPGI